MVLVKKVYILSHSIIYLDEYYNTTCLKYIILSVKYHYLYIEQRWVGLTFVVGMVPIATSTLFVFGIIAV
jgi:hypothetical protein